MRSNEEHVYNLANSEIIIRRINRDDQVSVITNLLHRSYKQLADLGFRYLATHQDDEETERRLYSGKSYIAIKEGRIIATVTLYGNEDSENYHAEFYNQKGVAHFGQFGVEPEFQGKGLGNMMMDIIESEAMISGASEIALDTAEGAEHLIRFYQKRGYVFVQFVQWSVTNYRSVIMSKKLKK